MSFVSEELGDDHDLSRFDSKKPELDRWLREFGLGLTPRQALMGATSGAAGILGLTDTGVLAPGRRADVVAVDGNPLSDIADLTRTRYVMLGGAPLRLAPTASAA